MEARYPNAGNPSPGEIFAAYKDLPQTPGGMQMLQHIIQQNQGTGSMNGSIAASILNAANQAKAAPPMPQGTVANQVMAQAQPPMDPNMMGLAAPGLEQYAQQQSMADGGIVAFAQGGPLQGYANRGQVQFSGFDPEAIDWGSYGEFQPLPGADVDTGLLPPSMRELRGPRVGRGGVAAQDVVDQTEEAFTPELVATRGRGAGPAMPKMPSTTDMGELLDAYNTADSDVSLPYSDFNKVSTAKGIPAAGVDAQPTVVVDTEDKGIPAAAPAGEQRTMGETSAKVPKLSADQQLEQLAKFYEGDHAKAAELKGQLEKRLASKENKDLITDIATGLGMMFTGQGTKTQAVGQGLMAFAAQHGRSGEAQDKQQATIDALTLQEEAQHNAAMKAAMQTIYGSQAKSAEQYQKHLYDMALEKEKSRGRIGAAEARAGGTDKFSRRQVDIDSALNNAQKMAAEDKTWPTLDAAARARLIESYLPPDLQGMGLTGSMGSPTGQGNLPAGWGYTPPR